jgi:hypothetical protein
VRKALGIAALVVGGLVGAGCDTQFMDDPERTLSLPNDTGGPRLVRRCDWLDDCRSPGKGELVQPGDSFVFKVFADEERKYIVGNAEGKTFGCLTVHLADGVSPQPESLSDLQQCPPGTPTIS